LLKSLLKLRMKPHTASLLTSIWLCKQ
jgi:hypothetical protein